MFRKMILWRQQVDADRPIVPSQAVIDNIPGAVLQGVDKEGDFIYVDRCSEADAVGIIERYGTQALLQHSTWMQELIQHHISCKKKSSRSAIRQNQQQSHPCYTIHRQLLVISDMSGLSRQHLHPKVLTTFGRLSRAIQDNYPVSKRYVGVYCTCTTVFHF